MATIIAPTNIPATDCIGNSLATINNNFTTLYNDIVNLNTALAAIQKQPYTAKAWVCFDGTTKVPTIKSSYNIKNITKDSTGIYTIYFADNTFSNTSYAYFGTSRQVNNVVDGSVISPRLSQTKTINSISVCNTESAVLYDSSEINLVFFAN